VTLCLRRCLYRGVINPQPVDERQCKNIFITIKDFGELAFEEADV